MDMIKENADKVADLSVLNELDDEDEENENIVDLFGIIVPELRDILFRYIGSESDILLKMSLVSRNWNNIVSNSNHFTSQYMFTTNFACKIPEEKKRADFLKYVVNSQRKYDSFKINRTFMIELLDQVPSDYWKYGELDNVTFKDREHVITFLNTFSPTVRDLTLTSIVLIDSAKPLKNDPPLNDEPEFKELEKLKISIVPEVILKLFMKNHPKLLSLELGKFMPFTETIMQLLRLNPQLQEIIVNDEIYNLTMTQELEFLNLKLRSLMLNIDTLELDPSEPQYRCYQSVLRSRNFKKFLISQAKTLEHFACYGVTDMPSMIFELWDEMTALKSLLIENPPWESRYRLPPFPSSIRVNPKLEDVTIAIQFETPEITYFEEILSKSPNTVNLYVHQLHKDIVTFAAYNQKSLKSLKCYLVGDGIQAYEQLKQVPGNLINRDINIERDREFI